jgi:hypothetical protein
LDVEPRSWDFDQELQGEPMKATILAISLLMPLSSYCIASAQLTKVMVGNNTVSSTTYIRAGNVK